MVVVAEENRIIMEGQHQSMDRLVLILYHRYCALQTTEIDGRPLQRRRLSEYLNDVWASRVVVSYKLTLRL